MTLDKNCGGLMEVNSMSFRLVWLIAYRRYLPLILFSMLFAVSASAKESSETTPSKVIRTESDSTGAVKRASEFQFQHSSNSEEIDCNSTSQRVLNLCAKNGYERSDSELNELYKFVVGKLQTDESKNRLMDAQRAWITFRDKDCAYVSAGRELTAHSITMMTYYFCLTDRTKTRIIELMKFSKCTQNGCPY